MERRKGKLPRALWILLDNTCRENNNKNMVGFCLWLVGMGFREEIRLSFLPVG